MKKVVFVGLRGFGIVLVKPNKNAILSPCHYFRRLLKRATASTEPSTSAIAKQRYFGQYMLFQYIAIDVETGDGFIATSAAAAVGSGQSAGKPGALFRLIRIGYKTGGNPTPQ